MIHLKIRGTQTKIPEPIEVNVDTVYVRSNIVAITTPEFTGWEYNEIQYRKDDYIALISQENNDLKNRVADLFELVLMGGATV